MIYCIRNYKEHIILLKNKSAPLDTDERNFIQLLNDIYDTEIENNEIEIAKEYIFNPKNFINLIKQLDDYQELQDLR